MHNSGYARAPEPFLPSPMFARKSDERKWYSVSENTEEEIQVDVSAALEDIRVLMPCPKSPAMAALTPLMLIPNAWRFQSLVAQWRKERGVTSSPVQMAMCPAYQQIMTMEGAIPLILHQLESEGDDPDHWFWALRFLADTDPVSSNDRGNMKKMAEAWLDWGRRHFYVW
jgi:hypothetical protein